MVVFRREEVQIARPRQAKAGQPLSLKGGQRDTETTAKGPVRTAVATRTEQSFLLTHVRYVILTHGSISLLPSELSDFLTALVYGTGIRKATTTKETKNPT